MDSIRLFISGCFVAIASLSMAQSPVGNASNPVGSPVATAGNVVRMEVFVRPDSEISIAARRYAQQLADRTPGLELVVHDILQDRQQLARLWKLAKRSGRDKPVVPAFYCCDQLYFGFTSAAQTGPAIENLFTIDVYTRSTCPKCKDAKAFIAVLGPRWPAMRFRIYEITGDLAARIRWQELCQSHGKTPGLPTIDFGNQVIVGYQGDLITGVELENMIRRVATNNSGDRASVRTPPSESRSRSQRKDTSLLYARRSHVGFIAAPILLGRSGEFADDRPKDELTGESASQSEQSFDDVPLPDEDLLDEVELPDKLTQPTPSSDVIDVPLLGELSASKLGFPLFTFLVGLIDGFNPCAMWILVFLLSVLVNIKDRRKILLIAGTFVVVSGLAYFCFMAAWLNLFLLIGIARWAQVILGVFALVIGVINVKDFFAFKKGVSLSIPESSKPGLYKRVREIVAAKYLTVALSGVITLAVIVNLIELLCTAGLPALYTQILTMQELPAWQNYGFLALYISAYMLDDSVLLGIVVATLSHRKLQEREGRWLKLISGVVILALGLVMIFKPEWLQLGQ